MAIVVNTNVQSLISQRNLTNSTDALNKSMKNLSTGMKINSASDDAAGLFVAKAIEGQIRGSQMCQTNIALAGNILQTAEGDLTTIQDNVMRIKDLVTQSSSSVLSSDSRTAIQNEVTQRTEEITRLANMSEFNGLKLLSGTGELGTSGMRIQLGSRAEASTNSITVSNVFNASTADALGLTEAKVSAAFANAGASAAFIKDCDDALKTLSERRSNIGATQNRLSSANQSLQITVENLSAAMSTIMDTDVASEASKMTKSQILQQSSAALLAQANQAPQIALRLIQ